MPIPIHEAPAPPAARLDRPGEALRVAPVRAVVALACLVARLFGAARDGVARFLIAAGITPNLLTILGPLVCLPVALAWALGDVRLGGWLLVGAGSFDLLDGTVARASGRTSRFGAFLDSVVDRYTDFVLFVGILFYFLRHADASARPLWLGVWALALLGAALPAYVRARAEVLLPSCKVGFLERAERVVTIIIGAMAGNLHLAMLVIAVFGNLIAAERVLYTREELEPESPRRGRLLWRHERLSAPHAVLCATLIAFLLFGHHLIARP